MQKAPTDVFPASYYVPAKGSQTLLTTSNDTGLKGDKRALDEDKADAGEQPRQAKKVKFT